MTVKFVVILTDMYPKKWFGGPVWKGEPKDNSFCYYHETKEKAQSFCDKQQKQER